MKMHVPVAAVLIALASRAAWGESEGGDTGSSVQAVQQAPDTVVQPSAHSDSTAPAKDRSLYAPDGFDTWSDVQALRRMTVPQPDTGNEQGVTQSNSVD